MSSFFRSVSDSEDSSSDEDEESLSSGSDSEDQGLGGLKKTTKAKKEKDSDDDSDDDDDEDDSDEDSDDDNKPAAGLLAGAKKPSRFLKGASAVSEADEDSDDEKTKVVKSAKNKRVEEVEAGVRAIENGSKINDWSAISNEFDKLHRLILRQSVIAEPLPVPFVKLLVSLDDTIAGAQGAKKKMNATNAKALNSMKQKLKKVQREFEAVVNRFKEDPEAFEQQAILDEAPASAPVKAKKVSTVAKAGVVGTEEDEDFQTVGNKGKTITISSEGIFKALAQVLEARGRKNTDRSEQTKILEKLLSVAASPYQRIRVLLALISALLDYNPSVHTHMPLDAWAAARANLDDLLQTLQTETRYVVRENAPDYDDLDERAPDADTNLPLVVRGSIISLIDRLDDEFTKSLQNLDPHTGEYIDRLKEEKFIYQTIVKGMNYFETIEGGSASKRGGERDHLDRIIMRRLEHIYCKPDVVTESLETSLPVSTLVSKIYLAPLTAPSTPATPATTETTYSAIPLVRALCVHLYKTDNSLLRTRAMLSHIYHYALHDDYYTARDMLLMSHLQDTIGGADVGTQILYNRTVVQVGLCAFRLGLIRESQSTLQEIFATQRVKELLAQGVQAQRYSALTPEQDKIERQRQLPFHMHINLELLESVYLVSSMLLEVPLMARSLSDPDAKKRVISRTFRRMLEYANRQVFTGPPENKRDHVMQATKALMSGDWQECDRLIAEIKVWGLMKGEKEVKAMLTRKIQEEGLRTYLFTYSPYYTSLSLTSLASLFSLSLPLTTSLVSRMIFTEELSCSLDPTTGVIIMRGGAGGGAGGRNELQRLALVLGERASGLQEGSERYLDSKISSSSTAAGGEGGEKGEKREGGERRERGEGRERRGGRGGGRGARNGGGQFNATLGRSIQVTA